MNLRQKKLKNIKEKDLKRQLEEIARFAIDNNISLKELIEEIEKSIIETALKKTNYNKKKAAELIKIHRNTIRRKIKKLNIKENEEING